MSGIIIKPISFENVFLNGVCDASKKSNFIYNSCKFAISILKGAEHYRCLREEITSAGRVLSGTAMMTIDLFNWASDVQYFCGGDFKKDMKKWKFFSIFCGFASTALDVECLYLGMLELNIIERGTCAATIGRVGIFGQTMTKCLQSTPVGKVIRITYLIMLGGTVLKTLHTIQRWKWGTYIKEGEQKPLDVGKVSLRLANCFLEGAFQVLMVTKCKNAPLLACLGVVAAASGIANNVYSSMK